MCTIQRSDGHRHRHRNARHNDNINITQCELSFATSSQIVGNVSTACIGVSKNIDKSTIAGMSNFVSIDRKRGIILKQRGCECKHSRAQHMGRSDKIFYYSKTNRLTSNPSNVFSIGARSAQRKTKVNDRINVFGLICRNTKLFNPVFAYEYFG